MVKLNFSKSEREEGKEREQRTAVVSGGGSGDCCCSGGGGGVEQLSTPSFPSSATTDHTHPFGVPSVLSY